jgi:hypothetical protein
MCSFGTWSIFDQSSLLFAIHGRIKSLTVATPVEEQTMRLQSGIVARELAGAALGILFCSTQLAAQAVVLQSATLGATGHISGSSITTAQSVGWRFQIDAALDVDHVGGHLLSDPNSPGDIFAALVAIDSITSVPHGASFSADETIATTVFRPAFFSDEIEVPLTAALEPGSYGLVFGTGHFGASGAGALPNFDAAAKSPSSRSGPHDLVA